MADGDTNAQVGMGLDESGHSLDRRTVRLARQELRGLPEETGKDLPDNIQAYWRELQGWVPQQEHVAVGGLGRERPWTLPATGKATWRIVVLVFIAKIAKSKDWPAPKLELAFQLLGPKCPSPLRSGELEKRGERPKQFLY